MNNIPNIFQVDKAHSHFADVNTTRELIVKLLRLGYQKQQRDIAEDELDLKCFNNDGVTYYLYKYRRTIEESDWSKFLPEELTEGNDFSEAKLDLILFIEVEDILFSWVGGYAYRLIASYINHHYGLMTYDKVISLDEDEAVSTKSRGITGARIGMSEQYRDNYRIINYLQFGKVPKQLQVKLSNTTSTTYFDFLLKQASDKLQIEVGRSIKINKSITFDELHRIVKTLHYIDELPQQELLSSYINITNPQYLYELRAVLEDKIWNSIPYTLGEDLDERGRFDFDFCNPNKLEEFYSAERYLLMEKVNEGNVRSKLLDTLEDKSDIYKRAILRASELYPNNKGSIISYLYRLNINCMVGDRITATGGFMYHFSAEFQIGNDAVFLVDGKWYSLKSNFVEALSAQAERVMKNFKLEADILPNRWVYHRETAKFAPEADYNSSYEGMQNYIVIDTIIVDGVELCDILHIREGVLYLIHVKHSFTSRVRELTNQIVISARRLQEAISAKQKPFFEKCYDKIIAKGRSASGLTKDEFYNKFMTCRPIYVFATASQLQEDLMIEEDIESYDSNIARFSLANCSSEVQTSYYDFRAHQIARDFV